MSPATPKRVSPSGHMLPNPQGLIEALQLMELGFELVRQRLIREDPQASSEVISERLNAWISAPRSSSIKIQRTNDDLSS